MNNEHAQAKEHVDAALATVSAEIAALASWEIENDDDNALAGEMLVDVKGRIKALEAKRKEITVPMNKALKSVNDLFREPRTKLEDCERILKDKIAGYLEAVAESNNEAYAAAGAAETAEEASSALAAVQTAETPKGVSMRYRWEPRIIAKDLLMPEFVQPDMAAIKAHMREHQQPDGTPCPIPGVVFDKVPVVSARSKS